MTLNPRPGPAWRRFTFGSWQITAIADGTTTVDLTQVILPTTTQEIARQPPDAVVVNPVTISINAYLLDDGTRCTLIDTGAGDLMGPTAGQLLVSLEQAGYQPAQIEAVLLTHIHGDHSGGLLREQQLAFPNAQVYVNARETDYWLSKVRQQQAPAARQRSFVNARRKVLPYQLAGRLRPFTAGPQLLAGIGTRAQPGHTPGHTYYSLSGSGQQLVFCADLAHLISHQLADPTMALVYDVDPDQAVQSRQEFLAQASADGYWLAAAHAPFPGIGQIAAEGIGYRWLPVDPTRQRL